MFKTPVPPALLLLELKICITKHNRFRLPLLQTIGWAVNLALLFRTPRYVCIYDVDDGDRSVAIDRAPGASESATWPARRYEYLSGEGPKHSRVNNPGSQVQGADTV